MAKYLGDKDSGVYNPTFVESGRRKRYSRTKTSRPRDALARSLIELIEREGPSDEDIKNEETDEEREQGEKLPLEKNDDVPIETIKQPIELTATLGEPLMTIDCKQ